MLSITRRADEQLAELRAWIGDGSARRLRENAGLSRLHVANELGTWPSTVQRWEAGERAPRGRHALEYHALLSRLAQRAGDDGYGQVRAG